MKAQALSLQSSLSFSSQSTASSQEVRAPLRVLIVEDDRDLRELEARLIKKLGHEVSVASNGYEAQQRVQEVSPDIVLLDVMMPEMTGFEFCQAIQAQGKLRDLHVIITSAKGSLEDKVTGLELGAADYLTKPFSLAELKARLQVGERIVRSRQAIKAQHVALEQLAREDALTGLANRRCFDERFENEWLRACRYHHSLSVIIGDLDHFKQVNDRYGHGYGDAVLREVGKTLLLHSRSNDLAARYGGEEFVLVLCEAGLEHALMVAERLRVAVKSLTFPHQSGPFHQTISFGVASMSNGQGQSPSQLLEDADKALYAAKELGRDRVEGFPHCQGEGGTPCTNSSAFSKDPKA